VRARRWCGISGFSGFYVANTVSLSFGALAVNDIVAAAVAVTFVEVATRAFYEAWPNPCVQPRVVCCAPRAALTRSRAQAVFAVDAALLQGASAQAASAAPHALTPRDACAAGLRVRAHQRFLQAGRVIKGVLLASGPIRRRS
jgi:hypothetical protein